MAGRIQKLAKQALATFNTSVQSASFAANLESLKSMMDSITASDINLSMPTENGSGEINHINNGYARAPATHVSIFECQHFTLGVFILHSESAIPIHDHPGMFGLCKMLYGEVKIRSYDTVTQTDKTEERQFYRPYTRSTSPLKCKLREDTLDTNSSSCFLSPSIGNLHTIINVSQGSSAFLDILAPPYAPDEGRDCTYYRECDQATHMKLSQKHGLPSEERARVRWLVQIPPPREFYCDAEPYRGPRIEL